MSLHDHVWWLLSRSAGITALLALTVGTVLGLGLANGLVPRRAKGAVLAVHEHLAMTALFAIVVHADALLGDRFLHPRVVDLLVPGLIAYRPAAVATGIVGGYLAAIFGLSFYARKRFGTGRWRSLHRFSALAWALSVVHTITAGTDAGSAWLRVPVFASVGVVAALLLARVASGRRVAAPGRA